MSCPDISEVTDIPSSMRGNNTMYVFKQGDSINPMTFSGIEDPDTSFLINIAKRNADSALMLVGLSDEYSERIRDLLRDWPLKSPLPTWEELQRQVSL